ncbi:MAG TPA: carbohydrate kinase family protein [Candidatus Saccharimonadales bacterium]
MGKTQLVVCGSIAVDRIMNFSGRYRELIKPEKLEALSLSTLLDKLEDSRGGISANISANLAVLGEKPVMLGSVGQDAKAYVKDLEKLGVDTSHVHFSNLPTASFNVITDSEGSQVGGFFQGAMSDSEPLSFKPWKGQDILAMVAAHNPPGMNRQVSECQELGLRLIYDPGQQVADPETDLKAGVEAAEIVLANDYELGLLCQRLKTTPEKLKAKVPILITTLGGDGSLIEGTKVDKPLRIDVAKPLTVLDPTGAGDAYRAGFLYGYLRQWDLQKCGQLGATLASFIIERHGTQPWFAKADVIERYYKNFKGEIKL